MGEGIEETQMKRGHPHNYQHGRTGTQIHGLWSGIKGRCFVKSHSSYPTYGARGITMCERWRRSLTAFLEDMGPVPEGERMTVDRLDNDKGYEPGNCRWATFTEQARNKTSNRLLTAFGETKCLIEWSEDPRCKCGRGTLASRLRYGYDPELAMICPRALKRRVHVRDYLRYCAENNEHPTDTARDAAIRQHIDNYNNDRWAAVRKHKELPPVRKPRTRPRPIPA
jgi:hypothetical protein